MVGSTDIFLIDDDECFCRSVKVYFEKQGIKLATVSDPLVIAAVDMSKVKVVLLDLDMPVLSGRQVLDQMPEGQSPIVIIVSGSSDIDIRLDLLSRGADFFLAKPVDLAELCLIAQTALGRTNTTTSAQTMWTLQKSLMSLTTPDGHTFGLSGAEFRVLEKLFENKGEATSKDTLIKASTGSCAPTVQQIRSLEVLLSRLRRRLTTDTGPFPVKSLRNVGYIFHGGCQITD